MSNINKDNKGFSTVEVIMVLVIVFLIGLVGYLVYKNNDKNKNVSSSKTNTVKTAPDPYSGWNNATLTYEKISYKYPSDWKVSDNSEDLPLSMHSCVYPGRDNVRLTSPSGESIVLSSGMYCIGDDGVISFSSIPINTLGQSNYLVFMDSWVGGPAPTTPNFACLSKISSATSLFFSVSKNIFYEGEKINPSDITSGPDNSFCYYPYKTSLNNPVPPTETLSSIENSVDFKTAELIFESMHY